MLEINFCLEWDPKQCGHGPGQRGFSQAAGQDSNTVQVGKNHLEFFFTDYVIKSIPTELLNDSNYKDTIEPSKYLSKTWSQINNLVLSCPKITKSISLDDCFCS